MSTSTISETKSKTKLAPIKMWNVIFLNDDFTPMDFVMDLLELRFGKTGEAAYAITMAIHTSGRGIVAQYSREVAEQKAQQASDDARSHGHPLMIIAEPMA
jgi:ATP-dependent Clp protease adaptor protein ClpS